MRPPTRPVEPSHSFLFPDFVCPITAWRSFAIEHFILLWVLPDAVLSSYVRPVRPIRNNRAGSLGLVRTRAEAAWSLALAQIGDQPTESLRYLSQLAYRKSIYGRTHVRFGSHELRSYKNLRDKSRDSKRPWGESVRTSPSCLAGFQRASVLFVSTPTHR